MNLIGSNLLAITILSALLIMGSSGISNLNFPDSMTPSFSAIAEGSAVLVTTSSIFSVLLIGIDQYLAVVDPLRYRTRIDKLKCGLLILTVWMLALTFGLIACLNPKPRAFLHLFSGQDDNDEVNDDDFTTETLRLRASIVLNGNATESANLEIDGEFRFSGRTMMMHDDNAKSSLTLTYGSTYALVYALFGYLVPFMAICWIYASIYRAARNNSERTRRTGSRPVLSSGSLSEEGAPSGYKRDYSIEDFRRIPKISSLSSIDENSEATPSQSGNPTLGLNSEQDRNVEDDDNEQIVTKEEKIDNSVVFTVGSTKVDASNIFNAKDSSNNNKSKVPISKLRAKFLNESRRGSNESDDTESDVKSKFPAVSEQRRKSSHDLMYEEMMLGCENLHNYEYEDSSDEEERHDYEESVPLSCVEVTSENNVESITTRLSSVNFDLSEQIQETIHNRSPSNSLPIVTITPPIGQKQTTQLYRVPSVKSTHDGGYINNLKYKISNGSLFKYREETRAARISALVVVMGLICWTPYVYLLLTRYLTLSLFYLSEITNNDDDDNVSLEVYSLGFLVLATYVTPLLFGYRSRRVKRELQRFFCFKRELSYKNNRSLMAKKVMRRRNSGTTMLGQFVNNGDSENHMRYSIFNCVYGKNRWPKDKVQFVQVPDTALAVETCRSSFSSGASTQISSTSTDDC